MAFRKTGAPAEGVIVAPRPVPDDSKSSTFPKTSSAPLTSFELVPEPTAEQNDALDAPTLAAPQLKRVK